MDKMIDPDYLNYSYLDYDDIYLDTPKPKTIFEVIGNNLQKIWKWAKYVPTRLYRFGFPNKYKKRNEKIWDELTQPKGIIIK